MALADLEALARDFCRPGSTGGESEASASWISEDQLARALETARLRYGEDRPLRRAGLVRVAEDGLGLIPPEGWTEESRLLRAEIWGERLCLEGEGLALSRPRRPGEEVRIEWRRPARLSAEIDEIPPRDREALAALAASRLLHQVAVAEAARFDGHVGSGSFGTNPNRSDIYKRRAEELEARYLAAVRAEASGASAPAGASATLNFGRTREQRARRIFHEAAR